MCWSVDGNFAVQFLANGDGGPVGAAAFSIDSLAILVNGLQGRGMPVSSSNMRVVATVCRQLIQGVAVVVGVDCPVVCQAPSRPTPTSALIDPPMLPIQAIPCIRPST